MFRHSLNLYFSCGDQVMRIETMETYWTSLGSNLKAKKAVENQTDIQDLSVKCSSYDNLRIHSRQKEKKTRMIAISN